ncbi:hypothetical protein KI387_035242, partial [Taxus chinensis]
GQKLSMRQVWNRIESSLLELVGSCGSDRKEEKKVSWKPPPEGWIKMNFDGASKGNPSCVGCGCVFRKDDCQPLLAIAWDCGVSSNNYAEGMALLFGLLEAKRRNWLQIWIEGDSLTILNMAQGKTPRAWQLKFICASIKSILASFSE